MQIGYVNSLAFASSGRFLLCGTGQVTGRGGAEIEMWLRGMLTSPFLGGCRNHEWGDGAKSEGREMASFCMRLRSHDAYDRPLTL